MTDYQITISNINKAFGNKKLFVNFSLNIKKNIIQAIIGPNGSGKTTLLRLITNLYNVDSGNITVNGDYSMLLENDYLYEDKSGLENIKIFGMYFNYQPIDFEEYSNLLNLTEHLDKRVNNYSKGMKRKLSLLIVILMNREIMFLDEPTSGVDPISRVEIRKIIEQLKGRGKTIIITSHDLSEVEKVAENICMLKEGKLIFNLRREEIAGKSLEDIFIRAGLEVNENDEKY